jgi:multicomponent Na+:H+ antiporter subunit D
MLLLLPILIPLAGALLTALLPIDGRGRPALGVAAALAQLVAAGMLLSGLPEGGRLSLMLGNWPQPYGIELVADTLSAALVLVSALLGLGVLLEALGQDGSNNAAQDATATPLMLGLLASVAAVFLAADLFNLYVWFELMLITTLGLLVSRGSLRGNEAAFKYLAMNLVGTLLLLMAVALIYAASGQLNFASLQVAGQWRKSPPGCGPISVCCCWRCC